MMTLHQTTTAPRPAPRLGFRAWWRTVGAWGPTREALDRLDNQDRPACQEQVTALIAAMVRQGLSPRPLLQAGLPAAARELTPDQLHAALDLARRLVTRGIDPTPALCHGLPVAARASTTPGAFAEHLEVLEELLVHLAAERQMKWDMLAGALAELTEAALDFHRQGIAYRLSITPEQGHRVLLQDAIPGYDLPLFREVYVIEAPQKLQLVPAGTATARRELAAGILSAKSAGVDDAGLGADGPALGQEFAISGLPAPARAVWHLPRSVRLAAVPYTAPEIIPQETKDSAQVHE
jgi:hypothetical protein